MIEQEDATPSLSQAIRMKQLSRMAKLTPEAIFAILSEEKPNQKEQIRIKNGVAEKVFSQPLQHAADGKSHPEAVGGPLPQQAPWAGTIISYTGAIQVRTLQ